MPSTWLNQFLIFIFLDLSAAFDTVHKFSPPWNVFLTWFPGLFSSLAALSQAPLLVLCLLMLGAPGSESLALPSSLSMLTLLEISPSLMALKIISTMMTPVLIYSGCHNKIPQTGWLKNRIFFYFSAFWRLKVQDKGASRADFCKNSLPGLQPSLCAFTQPAFCTRARAHTHTHTQKDRGATQMSLRLLLRITELRPYPHDLI